MMRRIAKWIRHARVSLIIDDASDYPRSQVTYNQVPTDCYRFSPYGISANPPIDGSVILLYPSGRENNPIAITDDPLNRFKDLEEGEVEVGHYETRTSIKFDRNKNMRVRVTEGGDLIVDVLGGDARISVAGDLIADVRGNAGLQATGEITLEAPTVAINGNLTVTGTIVAAGEVTGATKALSTHTHPGDSGGNTGPPN